MGKGWEREWFRSRRGVGMVAEAATASYLPSHTQKPYKGLPDSEPAIELPEPNMGEGNPYSLMPKKLLAASLALWDIMVAILTLL